MNILSENNYDDLNKFKYELIHNIETKSDLTKAIFYYSKNYTAASYLTDLFVDNLNHAISEGYYLNINDFGMEGEYIYELYSYKKTSRAKALDYENFIEYIAKKENKSLDLIKKNIDSFLFDLFYVLSSESTICLKNFGLEGWHRVESRII